MSQHMVIFQNPDGDQGYNQFESIDDAVSFVEKIRNEQGIDSIRIFELQEVKFDLKPYFKVELQALNAGSSPAGESRSSAAPSAPSAPGPQGPPAAASAPPSSPSPAAQPAPAPAPASSPGPSESTSTSPFAPPSEDAPSSAPPAPAPPADQPSDDSQPSRRGLFGR